MGRQTCGWTDEHMATAYTALALCRMVKTHAGSETDQSAV